jgi:hypothetical protein
MINCLAPRDEKNGDGVIVVAHVVLVNGQNVTSYADQSSDACLINKVS